MLKACACAGEQGSRGAGEQGSRGAREQGRVQCALFFPLCPSAFQTCEKCGINATSKRENGKQYYVDAKGNRFPSVTIILNATKSQADRDRLLNWKARVGTEEATRISTNASRRGTQTHKQIERYLLGQNPVCPDGEMETESD
ncbi:MAG: hypothetical protein V7L23_10095 [Nostoc sp.]|uniref:hypothetical protein n=1 Tax=Nostoc sp. TaxID=1180 RepID=UPI002FEF7049